MNRHLLLLAGLQYGRRVASQAAVCALTVLLGGCGLLVASTGAQKTPPPFEGVSVNGSVPAKQTEGDRLRIGREAPTVVSTGGREAGTPSLLADDPLRQSLPASAIAPWGVECQTARAAVRPSKAQAYLGLTTATCKVDGGTPLVVVARVDGRVRGGSMSPAYLAGIQPRELILGHNGCTGLSPQAIHRRLATSSHRAAVELTVARPELAPNGGERLAIRRVLLMPHKVSKAQSRTSGTALDCRALHALPAGSSRSY